MAKKKKKKQKELESDVETKKNKKKKNKKLKQAKKLKTKKISEKKETIKQVNQTEVYQTFSRLVQLVNKMSTEPVMFEGNSFYPAELKALEVIKDNQPISTSDLANKLKVTRSAILKTVNKLVHKGVVTKQKSQKNGRIIDIKLSELGQDFVRNNSGLSSLDQEPIMQALSKMNETELAYFNDALERILINIIH